MESTTNRNASLRSYYQHVVAGHLYVRETIDGVFDALARRLEGRTDSVRVLELGSHAGIITEMLLTRWPHLQIVVSDDNPALVAMAKEQLAQQRVEFHEGPLESVPGPLDFVISLARHHHLPHDYLTQLRGTMGPRTVYILGDELCPEYCEGEHAARIASAKILGIVGGYVFTSASERSSYERDGVLPARVRDLELLRQRALWRWYRAVVNGAVEGGYLDVAVGELQSCHDDLITGSTAEHKFSPAIVERQFELAGFRQLSKRAIGAPPEPELASMFVYEYGIA